MQMSSTHRGCTLGTSIPPIVLGNKGFTEVVNANVKV